MKRISIAAFVAMLSTGALSAEVRKIDFTVAVVDLKGNVAHQTPDKDSPVLTIGDVAATALLQPAQPRPGQQANPVALAKRAILAQRIMAATDATLTAEEVVEIKEAIGIYPPVTVLRVLEAIDPASLN